MPRQPRHLATHMAALLAGILCGHAGAAGVELRVSAHEVYVGVPFQIHISIIDAGEYQRPQWPEIVGLRSRGQVSSKDSLSITDTGRTRTVTLSYEFSAEAPGIIVIPPITVVVDGQELTTVPTRIIAGEIPEGADGATLLFAEVRSVREVYYLGETIHLALEIWLRPYFDDRYTVRYDAQAMLSQVSGRSSRWGVFRDELKSISIREIVRTDADGVQRAYFVYTVKTTMSPYQAGSISFDDISVVVNYPTKIRRTRGLFGDRWQTIETRPVAATVARSPIQVEPPPMQGRPASFAGAVGQFNFTVTARPRDVAVGDPITLTLAIDDRSMPATSLAVLKPPSLARDAELAREFRVAGDPPAGIVDGRRKTFTQTIRARNDLVAVIPALSFSYFDPRQREYVSVLSEPISVRVRPTAAITDSQIVGAGNGRDPVATELHQLDSGIQANYTGADVLLSSHSFALSWVQAVPVALGPLVFVAVALGRYRTRRLGRDRAHTRRRRARRVAMRRLGEAAGAGPDRQAILAASALSGYVADRFNLPAGALTTAEVIERLAEKRLSPGVLEDVERLLTACEQHRYAGAEGSDGDSIAQRATLCIARLERERLQ